MPVIHHFVQTNVKNHRLWAFASNRHSMSGLLFNPFRFLSPYYAVLEAKPNKNSQNILPALWVVQCLWSLWILVEFLTNERISRRFDDKIRTMKISFSFHHGILSLQVPIRLFEALVGVFWREHDGSLQLSHLLRANFAPYSGWSRSSGASIFSHRRHQSHPSATREHLPERLARNSLRKSVQVIE